MRARAHAFRPPSFVFCERIFFFAGSIFQHSRKQYARTIGEKLALRAHARSRTRFARVIGGKFSARAFIGQKLFGDLVKGHGAMCVGAGRLGRAKFD